MQKIASSNFPDAELTVISTDDALQIARFFQILADPTRVRLIQALADGCWCVSELVQALEMDQPAVSHQLKYLRRMDLVKWDKRGRHVYYTLASPRLKMILRYMLEDPLPL